MWQIRVSPPHLLLWRQLGLTAMRGWLSSWEKQPNCGSKEREGSFCWKASSFCYTHYLPFNPHIAFSPGLLLLPFYMQGTKVQRIQGSCLQSRDYSMVGLVIQSSLATPESMHIAVTTTTTATQTTNTTSTTAIHTHTRAPAHIHARTCVRKLSL